MGKLVISTRKNGEFQFNPQAGNGQVIFRVKNIKQKLPA